jgi:hypothetical protein
MDMPWDQIVLIIVVVWAVVLSYMYFRVSRQVAKLGKQPPHHTHPGEDVLFTTKVKE